MAPCKQYAGNLQMERVKRGVSCRLGLYIVMEKHNCHKRVWGFLAKGVKSIGLSTRVNQ